jgi:hypothetical protein
MTAYSFSQLINFTRTTPGTFVGSNGLIQTTPQSRNLLTFTQEFDNAFWTKASGTIISNTAVAPDGTRTADTVTPASGVAEIFGAVTLTAGVYTLSVWLSGSGTVRIGFFNATNGVQDSDVITLTGTLTRYSVTKTLAAGANNIYPITTRGSATLTSLFIWGAQLEQASTATDYTRNVGGLFPPRFDYDPVTLAPRGILIEEQRTNLFTYSEQFDDTAWGKGSGGVALPATVTPNFAVAPDGTMTADRVQMTLNGGTAVSDIVTLSQTTTFATASYTQTIWMRSNTGSDQTVLLLIANGQSGSPVTVTSAWQRFTFTNSITATTSASGIRIRGTFTGATADILVWGAQLEAGAFATSYIQTLGNPGGVTRAPDQASIVAPMFAPWYNQSEGTMVVDFSSNGINTVSSALTAMSDGTGNNINSPFINSGGLSFVAINSGGAPSASLNTGAVTVRSVSKHATAYQANNFAATLNGAAPATDPLGPVPVGVNLLNIGWAAPYGGLYLNGHIRRITYYPVRLSDLQLQALSQ